VNVTGKVLRSSPGIISSQVLRLSAFFQKSRSKAAGSKTLSVPVCGELLILAKSVIRHTQVTGLETAEIDLLIQGNLTSDAGGVHDEVSPIDDSTPAVSRHGDLWNLSEHRLLCADATKKISFTQLLGREQAQMAFIDPPYNVPIDGNVSGLGSIKHREFPMGCGEMSEFEFIGFL